MSQGEIIGSYQLTEPADGNPFGPYWLAKHMVTGVVYRLQRWSYSCTQATYLEAMQKIAQLRHRGVHSIHEFGFVRAGTAWTVTESPKGRSVSHHLSTSDTLAAQRATDLVHDIVQALEFAHGLGIAHGCLESSNVFVNGAETRIDGWGAVYPSADEVMQAQKRDILAAVEMIQAVIAEPPVALSAILIQPPHTMAALKSDLEAALPRTPQQSSSLLPSPPVTEQQDEEPFAFEPPYHADKPTDPEDEVTDNTVEVGSSFTGMLQTNHPPSDTVELSTTQESPRPMADWFDFQQADVDADQPATRATTDSASTLSDGWHDEASTTQRMTQGSPFIDAPVGASAAPESPAVSEWLDEGRDDVKSSNRYVGASDDSWGLEGVPDQNAMTYADQNRAPIGMRVHTVNPPQSAALDTDSAGVDPTKIQGVALVILVIALIGLGVQFFENRASDMSAVAVTDASVTAIDAVLVLSADEIETPRVIEPDASTIPVKPTVRVSFVPVEVKVVRAKDGVMICENARECELEIDTDYRATAPNYQLLTISGDDLYDRRRVGRWRRVMQPKESARP